MKKSAAQTAFARELRQRQTEAERMLWSKLRNKQYEGLKFRRQQPVGPYIVDFISFDQRLIIEIDGGQHNLTEVQQGDAERTAWLKEQKFRVLRFWNNEVLTNTNGVIERIEESLQ